MKYVYTNEGGNEAVAAVIDGTIYQATSNHPCWLAIKQACVSGELKASDFDAETKVLDYLQLADGVEIIKGQLYRWNEEMHGVLADKIISEATAGNDPMPLVYFLLNLDMNPSRNSRDQLFTWLERAGLDLTEDGEIIGYKSVISDGDEFLSVHSGTASVNYFQYTNAQIRQKVGDEVVMPRSEVTDNPGVACSHGLHVGTKEYAEGFTGDTIITVAVNPAHVVSVPNDSNGEKMRVCRYRVLGVYKPEPVVTVEEGYVFQNSSFLSNAQFDVDTNTLSIEMKSGKSYKYDDVDITTWQEFTSADDYSGAGEYYNYYIKE